MSVETALHNDKFASVEILAEDLSKDSLELPSFPDIVIRIRKTLADDDVTADQIVPIIGADPVLVARNPLKTLFLCRAQFA